MVFERAAATKAIAVKDYLGILQPVDSIETRVDRGKYFPRLDDGDRITARIRTKAG